jgi:DNA-binding transcriptional ArsR family regulator
LKKILVIALVLFAFAIVETLLAVYGVLLALNHSVPSWGGGGQIQSPSGPQLVFLVLWKNSIALSFTSWAVLGITFFRQGISRRWRSLGFDRDVFRLMVTMRGARSRLTILRYLNEPRHKTELSNLSGLNWKEVDRQLNLLLRFGLVTLHARSGSVKIYRLSEQGKLLMKLIIELKESAPTNSESDPSSDSMRRALGFA